MTVLEKPDIILLALCLPLALLLRCYRLREQGHRYYDEGLYAVRALFQLELLGFVKRNWRGLCLGRETLTGIFERLPHGWYARNANYQLHEWATALMQKLTGRKNWAGLAISALFGLLIVVTLPLAALDLGGLPAFRMALILITVDAVNVYYSRTAFGDTMASFFLLLSVWGIFTPGEASLVLLCAGLAMGLCLMSKTQYYFIALGLELCLAAQLWNDGVVIWLGNMVLFNLGLLLPIILIEGYYRLLRRWGYDQRTYLELVGHQYFAITKDGDEVEQNSTYRSEIPWLRWRWLQMCWGVQGPVFSLLLVATAANALWQREFIGLSLLLVALIPIANWLRLQFCALRYLFANHVLLVLLMALYLPGLAIVGEQPWALTLLTITIWASALWRMPRYFQQSGHWQALQWLKSRTSRVFSSDYYNAQMFFPRSGVRYAPNSLEEIRTMVGQGFRYWLVDLHATYTLRDQQEDLLEAIQLSTTPVAEFVDEGVSQRFFWWEYCYSKIVTPKYEYCFRIAPTAHRTIKIYDMLDFLAAKQPELTPGVIS